MKKRNVERVQRTLVAGLACMVVYPLAAQGPGFSNRFSSVVTGFDSYAVDNLGNYPPHKNPGDTTYAFYLPDVLTTPISYMQPNQLIDPFANGEKYNRFGYFNSEVFSGRPDYNSILAAHGDWAMWSIGPSRVYTYQLEHPASPTPYDPTNGTLSRGVILRNQLMQKETGAH